MFVSGAWIVYVVPFAVNVTTDFLTKIVTFEVPSPEVWVTAVSQRYRPPEIAVLLKFAVMLVVTSASALGATANKQAASNIHARKKAENERPKVSSRAL